MGKVIKAIVICIIVCLLVAGAFIAGNYLDTDVLTMLWKHEKPHTQEPVPNTEPHTADQVIDVETIVPFDDEGRGTIAIDQQKVPYVVKVDFAPILLEEAQVEKKLIIMSQRATAAETAKKEGLFSLPMFKQTKAIIFHGEGTYSIDLSSLSSQDFVIDDDLRTITIRIPKPELSVKLLPDETEFFDSSNGTLRFGEMEITPETMTELEIQGIARIKDILESDSAAWETAAKFAKLSVKEIYEPLVAAQVDAAVRNAEDEYAIPAYYTVIVEIKD